MSAHNLVSQLAEANVLVPEGGSTAVPCIMFGDGAPSDGTTGLNTAEPGSLYIDITNAILYINPGTKASPAYIYVGDQAA